MPEIDGIDKLNNEIAMQRQHVNKPINSSIRFPPVDLEGCTNLEISNKLRDIRLGLSSAFFPEEKEVIMQAEKRLTRKD